MQALILAAGRGERMRSLTDALPKPLLPVGGAPLIEHQIRRLVAAGCRDIVINTAYLGDLIEAHLGDGARLGARLRYSRETAGALETGGGIRQALPLLDGAPFLVVNADVWSDVDYTQLALPAGMCGHLVLVPNPAHHAAGDFALNAGLLRTPATDPTAATFTFAGIAIYRPSFFADLAPGRFPLAPLLRAAAAAGRLSGELHLGVWIDVGTPARLAAVDALLGPGRD